MISREASSQEVCSAQRTKEEKSYDALALGLPIRRKYAREARKIYLTFVAELDAWSILVLSASAQWRFPYKGACMGGGVDPTS